jgi:hypothetical protein
MPCLDRMVSGASAVLVPGGPPCTNSRLVALVVWAKADLSVWTMPGSNQKLSPGLSLSVF